MNNKVKALLISLTLLTVSACSSGGGDGGVDSSPPTDPATSFNLFPPSYFTSYSKSAAYSGSDTTGAKYTATASEQALAQSTFLGSPAIPIQTQIQFTNTSTGAFINVTLSGYYTTSASDRRYLGNDGDTQTVSADTTVIPQTGMIGDFGIVGTYTDNAGEIENQTWRLDDGTNGRAKLVTFYRSEDQFGNFIGSEKQTYLIDTNGNRISHTIELYDDESGITITLNGS